MFELDLFLIFLRQIKLQIHCANKNKFKEFVKSHTYLKYRLYLFCIIKSTWFIDKNAVGKPT